MNELLQQLGIRDPTATDTAEPAVTTPPSVDEGSNGTPKKRVYFADHVPTGRLSTYISIESWDNYVTAPPSPDHEDSPPASPVEEPPSPFHDDPRGHAAFDNAGEAASTGVAADANA